MFANFRFQFLELGLLRGVGPVQDSPLLVEQYQRWELGHVKLFLDLAGIGRAAEDGGVVDGVPASDGPNVFHLLTKRSVFISEI